MSKAEIIEGKRTNWLGLWYHPESYSFTSQAINLSVLKQFKGSIRMIVRKNRYFNKGENGRPNYVFSLVDSKSDRFIDIEMEKDEYEEMYLVTPQQVEQLISNAVESVREYDDGGVPSICGNDIIGVGGRRL